MQPSHSRTVLFSGASNPALTKEIATHLKAHVARCITSASDDEHFGGVQILDPVNDKSVYIVQSLSPPVNDNLMELLLLIACAKRSGCKKVAAVIPYLAYSRDIRPQDPGSSVPLVGSTVARLLESLGVNAIIAVDIHHPEMQGFFETSVPVTNLDVLFIHSVYFRNKIAEGELQPNPIIIAPEHGLSMRAVRFFFDLKFRGISCGFATIYDKYAPPRYVRATSETEYSKEVVYLGDDPKGRDCIIIEDLIDSTKRILAAVNLVKEKGAQRVYIAATHGLLTGRSQKMIDRSPVTEIVVTNTKKKSAKVRELSVGPYLAEVIKRIEERRNKPISEIVFSDTFEE